MNFSCLFQMPEIKSYMDQFPFPFYIILRDINSLPQVLCDALRQWFELVTSTDGWCMNLYYTHPHKFSYASRQCHLILSVQDILIHTSFMWWLKTVVWTSDFYRYLIYEFNYIHPTSSLMPEDKYHLQILDVKVI